MCGIAGFTHLTRTVSSDQIHRAVNTLAHRGPDQQGIWESHAVSLGATRLRIIDLESGAQPMCSDDDDAILVFNGEIYNYAELRKELIASGHRFKTGCDTEVVLHAFLEWDTDCFKKLRGMFAFAVWIQSQQRLVLVRDRLGIKPLYYHVLDRDIYFGSELKTLLCHPEIERYISFEGLNCYLCLNYVPGPLTLMDGIEKLQPGCFLTWQSGTTRIEHYWQIPAQPATNKSLGECKEELDFLLQQSIREHLITDVPLGIWLSGGIDSSTVIHYASQLSSARLKTFSITFRGKEFDESRYIREVSSQYGSAHHELDLSPDTVSPDTIQEFAYFADEPNADAGALPVWFLAKMSKRHVTVALSGEGADELFGGYTTYLASKYANGARYVPIAVRQLALKLARQWPASDSKIGLDYKLQRFLQGSMMPEGLSHVFWNGTFSEEEKALFFPAADRSPMQSMLQNLSRDGGLNRFLAFDQRYYLPDNILAKVDRMSMAHSMEVRPPFLDHRIVEFAASLPQNYKIRGANLKYILRELMKDKLPHKVVTKKKIGFDIPTHDWFRGHLKPLLLDTLTQKAVQESGLFRWEAVQSIMRDHMERRANYGYHLWGLLILFLWMKQWKVQSNVLPLVTVESAASSVLT